MKRRLFLWPLLLILFPVLNLRAQEIILNKTVTGVCYAGDKVKSIYIPPPDEYFRKAGSKGIASVKVYYSGFPAWAVNAVEKAASILETILPADARVTVLATWTNITTSGVLANSTTTGYAAGWMIDAFKPFALYPIALAEKIFGESLNDSLSSDIELNINSSINWYTDIDGKPLTTQYDLVTVSLHELIHGLGFFDSFNTNSSLGYYSTIPVVYDTFVENDLGRKLTDTTIFKNPSVELKNQLTSGRIYFNGPVLSKATQGGKAQLHAPATWNAGSSISHLDDTNTPDAEGLMTPFIDKGEAIHNPGKFAMAILGDVGWINTRIVHTPPKDTEAQLTQLTISASIKSDTTYDHDHVSIVWSYDGFKTSDTTVLVSPQLNDNYSVTLPVPAYDSELQYYLYAEDSFKRIFRVPSFIDLYRYRVYIGTDTVRPVLSHTPADYYLESVDTFKFNVLATDNIGIDTVYVEYKINNGPSGYLGLKDKGNLLFSNSLSASSLTFAGGDSIRYRIIAVDKAAAPNQRILPAKGYFAVKIEDIGPVLESYTTDFSNAADRFFNLGFTVSEPTGFSKYGLNSKHPYESPETDNDSIVSIAMLRNPVKFDASGMIISYRDLALVEPGETGSLFGTSGFYDYVVVQGSVDFGKTWFNLADGYDSRFQTSWETAYNSSFDARNNSTAVGNESMLVQHTLFPATGSHISAGDTLMVRFKLFSDPYAYGWGWVIEDLHIGPLINSVGKTESDPVIIYPNPGKGLINLRGVTTESVKPLRYSIFNTYGTLVKSGYTNADHETMIDLTDQPSGIYFIQLYTLSGLHTYKYSLIR